MQIFEIKIQTQSLFGSFELIVSSSSSEPNMLYIISLVLAMDVAQVLAISNYGIGVLDVEYLIIKLASNLWIRSIRCEDIYISRFMFILGLRYVYLNFFNRKTERV